MDIMKKKEKDNILYGKIIGDIFIREVYYSKEYLKRWKAWGLDADLYIKQIRPRVKTIIIFDIQNGRYYKATIDKLDSHGTYITPSNRKLQIVLENIYWNKEKILKYKRRKAPKNTQTI